MADNMIKFYKGLEASLPTTGVNGALYITTDEGAIYLGTGTGMKRLGDFVQVDKVADLPAKAHESCLYYCVAENILAKWNGTEWKQINKQPTAEELKTLLGLGTAAYTDASAYDEAGAAEAVRTYVGEIPETATATDIVGYIQEKTAGIATDTALEELTGRVATAEGEIDALQEASAKHVEKVDGKSLIADTEIARLAAMSDGANKVEASETNGNIKIDGVETVVYTHPDKHVIDDVTGLQDAIDDAKKAGTDANAALEAYKTANDKALADEATARGEADTALEERIEALEGNFGDGEGTVEAQIEAAVAAEAKIREDADKAINDKIGEVADGKTVVEMISDNADAIDAIEADYLKAADKKALQDQIDLIMNNPDTEKVINSISEFTQYIDEHGAIADGFRKDIDDNAKAISDHEALAAETYETKEDSNAKSEASKEYADGLNTAMNARVEALEAIDHTHDNKGIIDGITAEKVAAWDAAQANAEATAAGALAGVKAELEGAIADGDSDTLDSAKAYTDELANGQVKTNKEAIEAINNAESGILAQANGYADGLNTAMDERVAELEAIDHEAYIAADTALKTELQAEIDADVKALADGAVAANTDAIADIVEQLTWGSF